MERDNFHLLWIKHSEIHGALDPRSAQAVPISCSGPPQPSPVPGKERGKSLTMQMLEKQEMPHPGVLTAVNG